MKISHVLAVIIMLPLVAFVGILKVVEYLTDPLCRWQNRRQLEKRLGRKLSPDEYR